MAYPQVHLIKYYHSATGPDSDDISVGYEIQELIYNSELDQINDGIVFAKLKNITNLLTDYYVHGVYIETEVGWYIMISDPPAGSKILTQSETGADLYINNAYQHIILPKRGVTNFPEELLPVRYSGNELYTLVGNRVRERNQTVHQARLELIETDHQYFYFILNREFLYDIRTLKYENITKYDKDYIKCLYPPANEGDVRILLETDGRRGFILLNKNGSTVQTLAGEHGTADIIYNMIILPNFDLTIYQIGIPYTHLYSRSETVNLGFDPEEMSVVEFISRIGGTTFIPTLQSEINRKSVSSNYVLPSIISIEGINYPVVPFSEIGKYQIANYEFNAQYQELTRSPNKIITIYATDGSRLLSEVYFDSSTNQIHSPRE